jgi:hypothetical protein
MRFLGRLDRPFMPVIAAGPDRNPPAGEPIQANKGNPRPSHYQSADHGKSSVDRVGAAGPLELPVGSF